MNKLKELTLGSDAPGSRMYMLGNEAIARGAIEAGIDVVAAYPGTPSSEIVQAFIDSSKERDFYVEWSVNEKVAFEVAFAAAMTGLRSVAIMKCVGVNVAHDPLMTSAYMGTKGGFVLIAADDPSMWSSQTEQDSRYVAMQAYVPVLEPSSGQEAREMMKDALLLSEKFGQMFMFRSVTRISHARVDVELGEISGGKKKGQFEKGSTHWVCLPANQRKNRLLMIERMAGIKKAANTLKYNKLTEAKGAKLGIIASGLSYAYMREAVQWLGIEDQVSILKIGTPYPIPDELTLKLIKSTPEVLVVEELEPIVENQVKVLAQENKVDVLIHGKDIIPLAGELSARKVMEAIGELIDVTMPADYALLDKLNAAVEPLLPIRPPALCPGCPHRATLYAVNVAARRYKKEFDKEPVLPGDIGCYALGFNPPLNSDDTAICMGGAFGVACGLAKATDIPVIAHVGDSTFFHSGIPPMINAVYNHANITMLVMDNSTTGQTGFQPNPGTGVTAQGEIAEIVKIEDVARACAVKFVEVVDPFDLKATTDVVERALRFDGPALIVARQTCQVIMQRELKKTGQKFKPVTVDLDICSDCRLCVNALGCPAIYIEDDHVAIDPAQCTGCRLCVQVCPVNAIIEKRSK